MSNYYKKYEWSAFTEADLLANGKNGNDFGTGDKFVMGAASTKITTYDNDGALSGGSNWWCNTYSANKSGQGVSVNDCRVGSTMYAEKYHVLKGSDGKAYYLIEIKVDGHDSAGAGNGYFSFYGAQPPAGTTLTVTQSCSVSGSWVNYSCLGAGPTAPANTAPTFTNVPANAVFCVDENTKLVIDLDASDKNGDALSFSIVGGTDSAAFVIDAKTGELSFKAAPDYEKPGSSDGDNSYKVIVAVSDGKGGVTSKELTVNVCDVAEAVPKCIVIEAEDMSLSGYKVGCASSASENEYIFLKSSGGNAVTKFTGESGEYDFTMRYWDSASGKATVKVYVNGTLVGTVALNAKTSGWSEFTVEGLQLNKGDKITLVGSGNSCDSAIIDKITLCPVEPEPQPGALQGRIFIDANRDGIDNGEAGVAGVTVILLTAAGATVATTTTGANGAYLFSNLEPGDYKVVFPTTVGGRVLTEENVGSDDTIDSDADLATGETGTYTVVAGGLVSDVDAGLVTPNTAPDAVDDSAKTCAEDAKTVDVLANDSDADGDVLTITAVNGTAIVDGGTVDVDGVTISLVGGKLVFDASASAYAGLLVGEKATVSYSYEISDGNGGTDLASVDMTYCGGVNTLETIAASLPGAGSIMVSFDGSFGGTYMNGTLSGTGDARFDGITFESVYCVSVYENINADVEIPVTFHIADDSLPAGIVANPQNLDLVNWILNQDFTSKDNGDGTGTTYTEAEIQGAIWGLTDDIVYVAEDVFDYGTTANAQEIYDLAMAHGEGFVAGEGDIVGLIVVPTAEAEAAGNQQPLIIGVAFDDLSQDCLCFC